jgi:hypothetical protein
VHGFVMALVALAEPFRSMATPDTGGSFDISFPSRSSLPLAIFECFLRFCGVDTEIGIHPMAGCRQD